jgi:hypothetical protein
MRRGKEARAKRVASLPRLAWVGKSPSERDANTKFTAIVWIKLQLDRKAQGKGKNL